MTTISRNDPSLAHAIAGFQIDNRLHESALKTIHGLTKLDVRTPINTDAILQGVFKTLENYVLIYDDFIDQDYMAGVRIRSWHFITPNEATESYDVVHFQVAGNYDNRLHMVTRFPMSLSKHLIARIYQRSEQSGDISTVPNRIKTHVFALVFAMQQATNYDLLNLPQDYFFGDFDVDTYDHLGGKIIWAVNGNSILGKTFVPQDMLHDADKPFHSNALIGATMDDQAVDTPYVGLGGSFNIRPRP